MPRNRGEIVKYKDFTHNVILGRMKSVLRHILLHGIGGVSGQGPGQLKLTLPPSSLSVIPRLRNSIAVRIIVYKYIFLSMLQISG